MTKVPYLGVCKKRLSKDIGVVNSKKFIINNIEYCKKLFIHKKNYRLNYYLTTIKTYRTFSFTLNSNAILQNGNSLGAKIWHLNQLSKSPFIIFGSDIPNIKISYIDKLFLILKNVDVAIGPSYDGGFWSIGFSKKRNIPFPFKNIRWSSKSTLVDLVRNLNIHHISYNFGQKLRDIDILKDYCDYKSRFRQ
tara:strand:- start:248 stop:823 length:576 start_codon:yes stop_codon:yes gene_type:complete